MNLAELRKKAQKAKEGDEAASALFPCEVIVPDATPEEVEVPVHMELLADPENDDDPAVAAPEAEPAMAENAVRKVFDPVAILMAGRDGAVVDEVALADVAVVEAGGEEVQEFLCFRVSAETYAMNIMAIKEIIKPREVTEIPRAPAFVSGVLSLRGIIIPVFNMRLRLGHPGVERSVKERIIVLRKAEEFFGIVVDEVIKVVKIAASSIEKPPAVLDGIDRDFVTGIGRFDGQMLILLNLEKVLDLSLI